MNKNYIRISEQCSLFSPDMKMLGPVKSGATAVIHSAPGC
jgi:hypothetical protein